jgi:hypothetical protein
MRSSRAPRTWSGGSTIARIQARLMALYGVEAPDVEPFVRWEDEGRETLAVRQEDDALELALYLPSAARNRAPLTLDLLCQIAEGVSHFVYLVERARRDLPATHLELELQAEVDKFVVAADAMVRALPPLRVDGHALRERLFGRVRFLDPEGTELGERYRLANRLAARFVRSLEPELGAGARERVRGKLRRFFQAGQREKIEMALAA